MSSPKLLAELVSLPRLDCLTLMQLNEMKWRTKQQIFLSLLDQNPSSKEASMSMNEIIETRKIQRQLEKEGNCPMDEQRKKEESFRSDFLQIVSSELERYGAPCSLTWQKLLFDRNACCQSSKRRPISSGEIDSEVSSRPTDQEKPRSADEKHISKQKNQKETFEVTNETFKSPRTSPHDKPKKYQDIARAKTFQKSELEHDRGMNEPSVSLRHSSSISMINIPDSSNAYSKSAVVSELQQENKTLKIENQKLKRELDKIQNLYMESISLKTLEPEKINEKRVEFLKAQNAQIQREISMLLDVLEAQKECKQDFLSLLNQLKIIVENGMEDALSSGAGKTETSKGITWIMGVPSKILEDLKRVEHQFLSIDDAVGSANENRLRYDLFDDSAEKGYSSSTEFSSRDIFAHSFPGDISCISHLRFDRLQVLEGKMASFAEILSQLSHSLLHHLSPQILLENDSKENTDQQISNLLQQSRELLYEFGMLGGLVGLQSVGPGSACSSKTKITAHQLLKTLPTFAAHHKEKEKEMREMLKRLHGQQNSDWESLSLLNKQIQRWENSYKAQSDTLSALVSKVQTLWDKKIECIQKNMVDAINLINEAYIAYKDYENESTNLRDKNPFLSPLLESFEEQYCILKESGNHYKTLVSRIKKEVKGLLMDYGESLKNIDTLVNTFKEKDLKL